jgi:hypothetical protein
MKHAACAALMSMAGLCGCASVASRGARGETVVVEGRAMLDRADRAGTRQRALADAQKRAVERVSGVFVAAATLIEDAVATRQRIATEAEGRIERYDVIDEKEEAGVLVLRIRAVVLRGPEAQSSGAPRLRKPPLGTPAVEVHLGGASASVRARFAARGYALASRRDCEKCLLVEGEASAVPIQDARLGQFRAARARITMRVLDTHTRELLLERSMEASAMNLNDAGASAQALEDAGVLIGDAAAAELGAILWKRL